MSAYVNDPRVVKTRHGFRVNRDGDVVVVLPSRSLGWGAYTGPELALIEGGFATEDDAFNYLIGGPL